MAEVMNWEEPISFMVTSPGNTLLLQIKLWTLCLVWVNIFGGRWPHGRVAHIRCRCWWTRSRVQAPPWSFTELVVCSLFPETFSWEEMGGLWPEIWFNQALVMLQSHTPPWGRFWCCRISSPRPVDGYLISVCDVVGAKVRKVIEQRLNRMSRLLSFFYAEQHFKIYRTSNRWRKLWVLFDLAHEAERTRPVFLWVEKKTVNSESHTDTKGVSLCVRATVWPCLLFRECAAVTTHGEDKTGRHTRTKTIKDHLFLKWRGQLELEWISEKHRPSLRPNFRLKQVLYKGHIIFFQLHIGFTGLFVYLFL